MIRKIFALLMIVAVISFLGFAVENLWLLVTKGYMDNRGMIFPFLIGYGLAVLLIYCLFATPRKPRFLGKTIQIKRKALRLLFYFFIVMLCICIGEILLGKLVEKTCHFYWWNYSKLPLHITQYTSIPTSAGFSILIVIFMNTIFMPLYEYFLSWGDRLLQNTSVILFILMLSDYIYNAYFMYKKKEMNIRWRIDVKNKKMIFVH